MTRLVHGLATLLLCASVARAADGPTCRTFDRAPACCPHPPPTCCEPAVGLPVDDAAITQICGAATVKGQASGLNACKRYFERGETVAELSFGREAGDAVAFDKLRAGLAGVRTQIDALALRGVQKAFWVRQSDDTGKPERVSMWALVGAEIVHLEVEHSLCDQDQALRLFKAALERLRVPATSVPARRPG